MRISWGRAGDVKCNKTKQCPSSGHRVNFHHGGWYGAMVWTCAETVLLTQGYFGYCSAAIAHHQGFSAPHTPWQKEGWGCTKSWEGTQPGQLSPTHPEIYYIIWHHMQQIKLGEEGGRMAHLEWCHFPNHHRVCMSPAFLGRGELLPAHWKWWLNSLFYFASVCAFRLPIKVSLHLPTSFLSFILLILSPVLLVREWVGRWVGLSCQLGLNDNQNKQKRTCVEDPSWSSVGSLWVIRSGSWSCHTEAYRSL